MAASSMSGATLDMRLSAADLAWRTESVGHGSGGGGIREHDSVVELNAHDQPPSAELPSTDQDGYHATRLGMNLSWAGNIILLLAKIAAFVVSGSYSVLASVIDSVVDLASQLLVWLAERANLRWHPLYPTGRSRLETVAVLGAACIMATATVLVIRESIDAMIRGFNGDRPRLDVGPVLYGIIGGACLIKLGLWLYCRRLKHLSPAMVALAEDHWNDVISNLAAIIGPTIAFYVPAVWWIDPAAAIAISLYILYSWYQISMEQVRMIVGITAPSEFIAEVQTIIQQHSPLMVLDRILAYHFGQRYMVEIEVVMDANTTLQVSHDMAMELQHKVEALPNVERAYVHVDHAMRDYLEHKVERTLLLNDPASSPPPMSPEQGGREATGLRHRGASELALSVNQAGGGMGVPSGQQQVGGGMGGGWPAGLATAWEE